jgi:hypothetical protein
MTTQETRNRFGSLFINLPIELRIDVYKRVFNASLDDHLLPDPLKVLDLQYPFACCDVLHQWSCFQHQNFAYVLPDICKYASINHAAEAARM